MKFESQRPPRRGENVVPLINVVFLLLVFFMLAGRLQAPATLELTLPSAPARAGPERPEARPVLQVDPSGRVAWEGRLSSVSELTAVRAPDGLELRADRDVPARVLLPLLERLNEAGVPHVDLVTTGGP